MEMTRVQTWTLNTVFQFLSAFDLLLVVPCVCSAWKAACYVEDLWTAVLQRDFFPWDLEASAEASKDQYRRLKARLLHPGQLIRMQQGCLTTYTVLTEAVVTTESQLFASSARFCLTGSGRLLITGGKQAEGRRCFVYDGSSFDEIARMRDYREYHGMCLWGGGAVVTGGYEMRSEESETYSNTCEQLLGGAWRPLPAMTVPRAYHTLVATRQQLFAVAGMNSELGYLASIEVWDSACWRALSVALPEALSDPTAACLAPDFILVFGGMHEFGFVDSAFAVDVGSGTVEAYQLPVEVFTGNNCVTRTGEEFVLFNTLKEVVRLKFRRGVGIVS